MGNLTQSMITEKCENNIMSDIHACVRFKNLR